MYIQPSRKHSSSVYISKWNVDTHTKKGPSREIASMRNKRERPTARSYQILSNLFLSSFSCVCFNSSVFRVRGQPAIETGYYTHIEPEKKNRRIQTADSHHSSSPNSLAGEIRNPTIKLARKRQIPMRDTPAVVIPRSLLLFDFNSRLTTSRRQ